MAAFEMTAKSKKTGREFTGSYDFGETLAEAVKIHGEDVVFSAYKAKGVILYQDLARRFLNDAGNTEEDVEAKMADWKLGVVAVRGGGVTLAKTLEKLAAGKLNLDALPEDQLQAVRERIQKALAARKGAK